jgi:signal transduction histidine kinase
VLRGGEHLLRLIDDVLDLSRIEAGRISVSSEPVGLAEVLAEVVHTLEPMASRARIQIVSPAVPPGTPRVIADRTRLAQVLMNFGSNAIKYGRADGQLAFRTELGPSSVRITVIDDGIGIPEDKRDKIFEPFQRAGQEAGPIEGTGIGLTISKRLAEIMRGSVGFRRAIDRADRGDRPGADSRAPAEGRDHGYQPSGHERLRGGQAPARVARDARHPGDRPLRGRADEGHGARQGRRLLSLPHETREGR